MWRVPFGTLYSTGSPPPPPTPVPSHCWVSSSKCPLPVEKPPAPAGSGYTDHYHPDCWVCWAKAIGGGEAAATPLGREEVAGDGEGRGRCPPRSQRCPSQPSLQMHCQGSTQTPFTQPGKVTHWSHRGPCQPGWHLSGVSGGERWGHVSGGVQGWRGSCGGFLWN